METLDNCVSGRDVYLTLESGEFVRGKINTSTEKDVLLDDLFVLSTRAKLGRKRIPIEAISRFLPVFSNENEEREVVVKDSVDFTKTKDRTDCFVNEIGNIISSFLSANFNFEDNNDCVKMTNNMLQMINVSPAITKILEGKS